MFTNKHTPHQAFRSLLLFIKIRPQGRTVENFSKFNPGKCIKKG